MRRLWEPAGSVDLPVAKVQEDYRNFCCCAVAAPCHDTELAVAPATYSIVWRNYQKIVGVF